MLKAKFWLLSAIVLVGRATAAEPPSLCQQQENIVWSCLYGKKIYSVCASKDVNDTRGYVQYRAGTPKNIEFKYPAALQPPENLFAFGLLPHGASLEFANGRYTYLLSEDLVGQPWITVSKAGKSLSSFQCQDSTRSLTDNSTIRLFKAIGAYQ
jgi:hypothetical protein